LTPELSAIPPLPWWDCLQQHTPPPQTPNKFLRDTFFRTQPVPTKRQSEPLLDRIRLPFPCSLCEWLTLRRPRFHCLPPRVPKIFQGLSFGVYPVLMNIKIFFPLFRFWEMRGAPPYLRRSFWFFFFAAPSFLLVRCPPERGLFVPPFPQPTFFVFPFFPFLSLF